MSDWDKLSAGRESAPAFDERKRAGGVSGFAEDASWWERGGSCAMLKVLLKGMSAMERVSLFRDAEVRQLVMDAVDSEKAEWARRDAEEIPKILESKGKYPRKKTVKPYWMRTIESLNESKRGSERLVGDWVMDPESECDPGEWVVVGLRYPEKRYALCKVDKARHAKLFADLRPDITIPALDSHGEFTEWRSFMAAVERALGVTGVSEVTVMFDEADLL